MDSTTYSIKSITSTSDQITNNITATLRRLKIQEDLLLQNIKKDLCNDSNDYQTTFYKLCLEFKDFVNHNNNSYTTIKNLFTDVKLSTQSQETLKSLDLNDLKRDILELDEKIKTFKIFLQSEQSFLKQQEQDLAKEIIQCKSQSCKVKINKKVSKKTYSDIIPSPVKNLINSPLKCPEVQKFQDFLSATAKCGGWNEYHHNIFVKFWQKHIKTDTDYIDSTRLEGSQLDQLADDFLNKVPGYTRADVTSHINWYSTYLHLKSCQQSALEEWRTKNKPLKASNQIEEKGENFMHERKIYKRKLSHRHIERHCTTTLDYISNQNRPSSSKGKKEQSFSCIKNNNFPNEKKNILGSREILNNRTAISHNFATPTIEWVMKCNDPKDPRLEMYNVDHITKLTVPAWRLGVHDNIKN